MYPCSRRAREIALAVCAAALLAACGGEASPTAPPAEPPAVSTVEVSDSSPQATTPPEEETAARSGEDVAEPTSTGDLTATSTPTSVPTEATTQPTTDATEAALSPTVATAPAETTSAPTAAASFDPQAVTLELEEFANGLAQPLFVTHAGDDSGRLFLVEKGGTIRTIPDGDLFLDIRDRVGSEGSEQGLLGLAFHPDFEENGFFYVNYTNREGNTVVARYTASGDGAQGDPGSEQVVLTQEQPAANHNGGMLAFGPDNYLYIGLGDGGGANDTYGNGQNMNTFLAKILRIDVNSGDADNDQAYGIPEDNPFVDEEGVRPEIWATGLRNPWRFSFDRETEDLYIADVGQNTYEWVNYQPADVTEGRNYGWPITEGNHCFQQENCDRDGLTPPILEYTHDEGCSITGGYVYRGDEYPALQGAYLFGDYCSGRLWTGYRDEGGEWSMTEMAETGRSISSFGEDAAGELYLTDLQEGTVHRVIAEDGR